MRAALIALALIALPSTPAGADEPTGYAEFPWGTARSAMVQPCTGMFPPTTFPSRTAIVEMSCWRAIEIGGARWNPRLFFIAEQLVAYQIGCEHCYEEFRRIVLEKFGAPHRTETAQYRMGTGRIIEGEVATWDWPGGAAATLRQRHGKINHASLFVSTPTYRETAAAILRERAEKAKKAF